MNSSAPWWSIPTFTLGGVLMTLLVTVWLDQRRSQRESRHRWTEQKMAVYSEVLDACDDLREIPVWPVDPDAEPTSSLLPFAQMRRVARRAGFLAPTSVREHLTSVVVAARELAAEIDEIRATTKRGHAGTLDDRVRSRFEAALTTFDGRVNAFAAASRSDIDIAGSFESMTGQTR